MLQHNTHRQNLTSPSGMPCPQCTHPILLSIEKLLAATPVFCSECGLKLELNLAQSRQALGVLQRLNTTLKQAE